MAAKSALDLLPAVRDHVLRQAAAGYRVLALSRVAFAVDRPQILGNPQSDRPIRTLSGFVSSWSQQKKRSALGHRGWVQTCMSRLAKEGLLWERHRPEGGPHYAGERSDKMFRVRLTKEEAREILKTRGITVTDTPANFVSCYWTKSLEKA